MKVPKKKGRKDPKEREGGKALERLQQFELERGLEQTDRVQPVQDAKRTKK